MPNQQEQEDKTSVLVTIYNAVEYLFQAATLLVPAVLLITFTVMVTMELTLYVSFPGQYMWLLLVGSIVSVIVRQINNLKINLIFNNRDKQN